MAGHTWYNALTPSGAFQSGPAGVLLIFFFCYGIYIFMRGPLEYISSFCCKNMMMKGYQGNEEIDLYQNCLDDMDKQWSLMEEENSNKYGIQTMLKETKDSFKEGKMADDKFHLQGCHTYDILRNPQYISAFQYFAADLPDREDFIIDGDDDTGNNYTQSDLVRIALNLAYLSQDDIQSMNFDSEGI